jgi:hypothetical protein
MQADPRGLDRGHPPVNYCSCCHNLSRMFSTSVPIFYSCRRIPKDLTEATLAGGALSIVAAVAMIFLFGMELQAFLQTSATTTVIIDRSRDGDVMRINFNFSFPALSCEFASVDVSDVLGTVS